MSGDETLALEPARSPSPLTNRLAIGLACFLGGVAATAGLLQFGGWTLRPAEPAPAASPSPAPQPTAAPAPPPETDVATLAARELQLAGRLDMIEARLRDADTGARSASGYATQAERLMVAAAVRRAVERGQPLGMLEGQLRRRFGETHGDAVAAIVGAAAQPVTLEDLRLALEAIGPRLLVSPDEAMWPRVRRWLGDLVVLRRDETPSPRPADRLRRARRMLAEGQTEAALAEIAHLPGAAAAESWTGAARRYIAAREALRIIDLAAMQPVPIAAPTN